MPNSVSMFFRRSTSTPRTSTDSAHTHSTNAHSTHAHSTHTHSTHTHSTPSIPSTPSTTNRILSSFNPTLTLHIPPHRFTKQTDIFDLTPFLLARKTCPDPAADRRNFQSAVKNALQNEQPEALFQIEASKSGTCSLISTTTPAAELARWKVPWKLHKPIILALENGGCQLLTPPAAPRTLEFSRGGATFLWRPVRGGEEWVLDKRTRETGRYVVAVFLRKVGWRGMGGTLLVDGRGVEVEVAVGTVCVVVKKERQRWAVLGGNANGDGQ